MHNSVIGGALRGSSGAEVMVSDGLRDVIKKGNRRVGEQAAFLVRHRNVPVFPDVRTFGSTWYQMERLTEVPIEVVDFHSLVESLYAILSTQVWTVTGSIQLSPLQHLDKLLGLVDRPLYEQFADKFHQIDWTRVRAGLTHGDPTFDNMMLRHDGQFVIIDPIPATPAVPDLIAVDMGKVLQSCFGFERIRYGGQWSRVSPTLPDIFLSMIGSNIECQAALYWCAVHLVRAIPYMESQEVKDELGWLTLHVLDRI